MYLNEYSGSVSIVSGNDAIQILEIIQSCLSCNTEEQLGKLFSRIRGLFPFDFAGSILGHLDNNGGLVITSGVNFGFPEEWLREYLAKDYFNLDCVTPESFRTPNITYWSYLTRNHPPIPDEIRTLDMDFGVLEFYCHGSLPEAPGREGSVISFAGRSIREDKRTEAILEYLTPHLHRALSRVLSNASPALDRGIVLSVRESEVLRWLKHGKSSWDISVILGISERTVNYHVYNIMEKLDAKNRPQAVAIATSLGLLGLD